VGERFSAEISYKNKEELNLKAMRSFSKNAPSDYTIQRMNKRFLCTEVVGRKLTQPFFRTKNDIGSDGTLS
jgi:hypothetical protein